MTKKFQKDSKTIELDDSFSIWGAIFGCFYPLYKGLGKSAGLLFLVNLVVAIALTSVDSSLALIINCVVAGFVAPKLMLKQLNDDKWTEVKE
jgi:hypothetical protein